MRHDRALERGVGVALDLAAALVTLTTVGWVGYSLAFVHARDVLAPASASPAAARPVPEPEEVRREARKFRELTDHLGAGNYYRQLDQPARAAQEFLAALALDPGNADARQALRDLGVEPSRLS